MPFPGQQGSLQEQDFPAASPVGDAGQDAAFLQTGARLGAVLGWRMRKVLEAGFALVPQLPSLGTPMSLALAQKK